MAPPVARFHVDSGPASLFERVRQVFTYPRQLQLHGRHLAERITDGAPLGDLEHFDPAAWELVLVEARADTGRFVSTTWRRVYPNGEWWVVVGYQDAVQTLYRAKGGKQGLGSIVVRSGPIWDLVERVNARLVTADDA